MTRKMSVFVPVFFPPYTVSSQLSGETRTKETHEGGRKWVFCPKPNRTYNLPKYNNLECKLSTWSFRHKMINKKFKITNEWKKNLKRNLAWITILWWAVYCKSARVFNTKIILINVPSVESYYFPHITYQYMGVKIVKNIRKPRTTLLTPVICNDTR